MTLRIAVCDDELSASSQIDLYLNQIQLEENLKFQVFFFSSGEELLSHMPRNIHVLLLDIQMKQENGIDVARKLREEGLDFYLFFITSHVQYALEGYEVHAYAFLQKPLRYAPLKMYLLDVLGRLRQAAPFTLNLKSGDVSEIIDCSHIIYIEVYSHCTYFILDDGRKEFSVPLNELEQQLKSHGFFRCHKSYLVNLRKVISFRQAEVVMSNQEVIPLSRHRKQEFLAALHTVIGE